jgi:hypothetical protein
MPINHVRDPVMVAALNQFIAEHIEEIRSRTKGKNDRLLRQFTEQTQHAIVMSTFTDIVKKYMRQNNITLAPSTNKYYKYTPRKKAGA